jgi:colicin import membrane protein
MRGFSIMVATIVSTVFHFFILTLLDTMPLISKEIPQRNLYMVDLIPLPAERPAPQEEEAAVPKQAAEVKKEEPKKEEVKKEEVKKEEPKKETVKQEEKKDTVVLKDPDKKKTTPEKATAEKSTTKEGKEKPTNNDEQQRRKAIEGIEQKVAAREQGEVTAAEIERYVTMVENRVKGLWVIPDLLSARELKAVVVFGIDKKGEVIKLRFKQSSGNAPYDQSVLRAISKAVPFSSPPQGLLGEEYELTFEPKL